MMLFLLRTLQKVFEGMKADSEIDVYHFEHALGRDLAGMSDQRNYWTDIQL